MASFLDSSESTLSRSRRLPDGDLVEMRRQCLEHAGTLEDYESGTLRPPVSRNITLSAESQFLSTTISNFGDLIITSGSAALHANTVNTRSVPSRTVAGGNRLSVPAERRTTLRQPETATDYARSVLSSRSSSLSPSITRRHTSPTRNAASTQVSE
jgi:urease beta subunit